MERKESSEDEVALQLQPLTLRDVVQFPICQMQRQPAQGQDHGIKHVHVSPSPYTGCCGLQKGSEPVYQSVA